MPDRVRSRRSGYYIISLRACLPTVDVEKVIGLLRQEPRTAYAPQRLSYMHYCNLLLHATLRLLGGRFFLVFTPQLSARFDPLPPVQSQSSKSKYYSAEPIADWFDWSAQAPGMVGACVLICYKTYVRCTCVRP